MPYRHRANKNAVLDTVSMGYTWLSMTVRQLLEEAKRLDPVERAELLEQLFETFQTPDPSIEAAWAKEAEDRLAAHRKGELEGRSFDEVLDEINQSRN